MRACYKNFLQVYEWLMSANVDVMKVEELVLINSRKMNYRQNEKSVAC
jgi:hypothetical protein